MVTCGQEHELFLDLRVAGKESLAPACCEFFTTYLAKSNAKEEGVVLAHSSKEHTPSWWGKHGGGVAWSTPSTGKQREGNTSVQMAVSLSPLLKRRSVLVPSPLAAAAHIQLTLW